MFFAANFIIKQSESVYLNFEMKVRKTDNTTNFIVATDNTIEVIRLFNMSFALTIHHARFSTSSCTETEQNNHFRPTWTILRLLTQTDGGLSAYFGIMDGNEGDINIS